MISFFPAVLSSHLQPTQHNAIFHQSSAHYMHNLPQRRYTDVGQFECPKCSKTYSYFRTLKRHLKLECGKEPQLQCPYCPKRTIHNANLKKHIFRMHSFRWPLFLMGCLAELPWLWTNTWIEGGGYKTNNGRGKRMILIRFLFRGIPIFHGTLLLFVN